MIAPPLLEIEDLRISFGTRTSDVRAVDGVNLEIRPGEVLGLVGESGSGKSVTARSIMPVSYTHLTLPTTPYV